MCWPVQASDMSLLATCFKAQVAALMLSFPELFASLPVPHPATDLICSHGFGKCPCPFLYQSKKQMLFAL